MDRTAVIHFSGICAHVREGDISATRPHKVVIADVSDPQKYAAIPLIADLPPHTARLIVRRENITNPEVFSHPSSLPIRGSGDAWSWQLDGVHLKIEVTPPPGLLSATLLDPLPASWITDVPSLQAHAPQPAGQSRPLPDEQTLQTRAAAIVSIGAGKLVPVNFDPRSGGTAVQWHLDFPEGSEGVSITFTGYRGQKSLPPIQLKMPLPEAPGPIEPLIQIENVGTTKDDERDFLFHYYALFGYVPENARPPRTLGVVVGGAGVGCSNSSYP